MSNLLAVPGYVGNNFYSAEAVSCSPAADSNFGEDYANDGEPGSEFKFGSLTAGPSITFDTNRLLNGDMEDWTETDYPDNFVDESTGTGSIEEETTVKDEGDSSAKLLNGADGVAIMTQIVEFIPGSTINLYAKLYGDASVAISIMIKDMNTGYWLNNSDAWQATTAAWHTQTAAAWLANSAAGVVLRTFTQGLYRGITRLKVSIYVAAGANKFGYVDEFSIWPSTDLFTIHGHNIDAIQSIQVRSSTDNFDGSDDLEDTMTVTWPSCFLLLSAAENIRYWRFKFVGTNAEIIKIGEIGAGQAITLGSNPDLPYPFSMMMPGSDVQGAGGQVESHGYGIAPLQRYQFQFFGSETNWQIMHQVWAGSRYGDEPIIIVPEDDAEAVHMVKMHRSIALERRYADGRTHSVDFSEMPYAHDIP